MRRRLIPLFLLIAVLYSCKKDHFIPEEIHLLKLKRVDSAGAVYNTLFELDQTGRITKVSWAADNGTPTTEYTITYAGNVATISHGAPFTSGTYYHHDMVTYLLNDNHLPIQRIQYDTFSVSPPETPQRTTKKDTARYEYDAAGLLKKVSGTIFDSTWLDPGVVQLTTNRRTYTRDYTNSNGKLTGITTHMQDVYTIKRLSYQAIGSSTTEATHTFEYIHNEPNKTDFVNVWLLAELGILYGREYPLNKSYSYFPEKISYSDVDKDANGQITGSDSYSHTFTLDHTKFGFIAAYTPDGRTQDKVELIYNR